MLRDTMRLLHDLKQGDFARTVAAGLQFIERYREKHGKTPRDAP